jgi:hypothetical protein
MYTLRRNTNRLSHVYLYSYIKNYFSRNEILAITIAITIAKKIYYHYRNFTSIILMVKLVWTFSQREISLNVPLALKCCQILVYFILFSKEPVS